MASVNKKAFAVGISVFTDIYIERKLFMLRNIIVRTVTFSLALVFGIGSIFAAVPAPAKTFKLGAADLNRSQTRVVNYESHAYKMTLASGQHAVVTINAAHVANLKVTTGDGKVFARTGERFYKVELNGTGDTTIELSSITPSLYSIEFKQS